MSTILVDDHLLGDVVGQMVPRPLTELLRRNQLGTTNLYYYRLCRAALDARGGAITHSWSDEHRRQAAQVLTRISEDITVIPMRQVAFRMAELARDFRLSALGAEAIAAAETLDRRLCVWEGDLGPNMQAACKALGVRLRAITRD